MRALATAIVLAAAIVATAGIARAQQQAEVPSEAVGVLQYLEGTWEFTGRIEEQKLSGTFTARWTRGRYALITQDSTQADGRGNPILSAGVIGWDPARKQITHFGFASDNNVYVNRWNVTPTGDWVGELTGTRDGKEFTGAFKVTKKADTLVLTSKDADGKDAEFVYKKLPTAKPGAKKQQR